MGEQIDTGFREISFKSIKSFSGETEMSVLSPVWAYLWGVAGDDISARNTDNINGKKNERQL